MSAAVAAGILIAGCGGAGTTPRTATRDSGSRATAGTSKLEVKAVLRGQLPTAIEDAATAPLDGGRVLLLGGLDAADTSTASITELTGSSAAARGALPTPQHDAEAARIGRYVYVFGGGEISSYDHILRYDPATGVVAQVGTLPTPASDVAVAALGGVAYVVGGYDGTNWLDTILAWRPGGPLRVAGRLPFGLRYAALAADRGRLIVAGGTTPAGVSDAILSFDPATGQVGRIGQLPVALTHASAAQVDGRVLVIGGRRQLAGDQTSMILAVDPDSGITRRVGRLPRALSDASVASVGKTIVVAGGESENGVQRGVLTLTPDLTTAVGG